LGIFSLFGKKEPQPKKSAEGEASRSKPSAGSNRPNEAKGGMRPDAPRRDDRIARATALKIDAIESEMSTEFINATTIQRTPAPPSGKPVPSRTPEARTVPGQAAASQHGSKPPAQATQPPARQAPLARPAQAPQPPARQAPLARQPQAPVGGTTDFLLNGNSTISDVASPSSEAAAVIEESAIMYSNGQNELVGQMLRAAIEEDALGPSTRLAWWMLFDLLQLSDRRDEFEQLAIEYTNKFESSPPGWTSMEPKKAVTGPAGPSTPAVSFSGKLDAGAAKNVERIRNLAGTHPSLRLEFTRVSEADVAGCSLLLSALKALQKSGHNLVLVGAPELAVKIRAIIQVERRDDSEDAWLLLLEILRLLSREQEFEEASIDYCITFEVSPPAFVAPKTKVTTAVAAEPSAADGNGFVMPPLVEGRIDNLILAIAAHSDHHSPAIVDCSQLRRVDFNAAGRLLTGLAPFCGNGKIIEFHNVNHLVAELFNVMGLKDILRIVPRKN
jgi:ABC-type transporter Mla MlaB component